MHALIATKSSQKLKTQKSHLNPRALKGQNLYLKRRTINHLHDASYAVFNLSAILLKIK
jgi:hypothetical protein